MVNIDSILDSCCDKKKDVLNNMRRTTAPIDFYRALHFFDYKLQDEIVSRTRH